MKLPEDFKIIGFDLYPYQIHSTLFGIKNKDSGLILDMGLGKTIVSLTIARYKLRYYNDIRKVLVVCPPTLLLNWKRAIDNYTEYNGLILPADKKNRAKVAKNNKEVFNIINYEALFPLLRDIGALKVEKKEIKRLGETKIIKKVIPYNLDLIKKLKYDIIIYDESAKYLKHVTSKRTMSAIHLSNKASHRMILTGTLIGDKPLNLWSQFMCLDCGKSFGANFYRFRSNHFDKEKKKWISYKLKQESIPIFKRIIKEKCIRYKISDCIKDLPEVINYKIIVPLEGELKKEYTKVKKEVLAEFETKKGSMTLTFTNALSRLVRLQQVTAGFVSKGKGTEKELKYTPKMDAAMEEIETIIENGESVVIWCRFTKSINMFSSRLKSMKIKHLILDGRIKNNDEKDKIWRKFQTSKSINVFIGQIESGGFGIELFKEHMKEGKYQNVLTYENMWSPDIQKQKNSRVIRRGLTSPCRLIEVIVENTIDEKILKVVSDKKKISDIIVDDGIEGLI